MAQKNNDNAYAEMQTAAQEAQNINSERLRNVALEKQDQLNNSNNMQVMAEAGGILANDIGPSTAATLGKYGFPKTQRTQGREVKVKPNNITIVNNNITTTTNNVTGGGGSNKVDDGPAKFKTWVSNAFARQKEESSRREKEYNKREWSLSKSANKMLRKMESASKEVANTFNPKNIGTTVGNQMKMLLMLFGVRFLAKHWTSVLDGLSWIYKKVSQFIAFLGFGEEGARLRRSGDDITGKIVSLFGGDPRSSDKSKSTIIGLFGKLLNDFRDHIKLWFEKQMALRGEAMKSIQFPTLDFGGSSDGGIVGGIVNGLGNVFSKAFSGVTEYLGNILTVLADPKAGAIKGLQTSLKNDSLSRASEYRIWEAKNGGPSEFTNHGEVNSGDYSLFETRNGRRKNTLLSDAVDDSGRLNGTAGASVSQGRDILGAIQVGKDFGYVDTARVASGLERLYASSQEGGAIVDRDFLNTIFGATQHNLISSGKIQPVEMKFVEEKMSSSDKARENEYAVQVHGGGSTMSGLLDSGLADTASMALYGTGNQSGWEVAGRLANNVNKLLNPATRIINGIKGYNEASAREDEMKNKKYILVPVNDPRPEAVIDGKRPGKQTLYKLTPEALQFAGKNFGLDGKQGLTSENYETFLPGVEKWLINRSGGQAAMDRAWKSKGQSAFRGRSQRVDYSDALKGIRRLSDIEKAYDTRLANDAWSQDVAGIKNGFRELGNSAVHAMGEGMEWIGEGISAIASRSSGKKGNVSTAELHNRQNYLMKLFTERGMSPAAAAGIIGNLTCEALFVKDTGHQYKDGKAWSAGIAGFYRYGEWPSLEKWARENGKDWRKFETQAEYIAQHPKFLQIARETVGMNDKQAMVHAANMWAYRFEKFKGYDPKKSDYRPQEYRKRQGMAAGILSRTSGINVQDLQFDSASLGTVPPGSSQSSVQSFSVSYSGSSIGEVSQGKIVLVGDSYAAGMASSFKANVKSKGREAEATVATQRECNEKATNKCCVSGATIERIGLQAQHALSFSPAVMVIHAGLNNSGESESSLINKLVSCGSIPKSKGVQVFLIAPITNQTGKFNSGRNSGNAAKVARAVRSACKSAGYGLIDLEPTNSIYEGKFDGEGIHPKNYSQYAKDTVELLFKGGGLATASISSDGSYVGSDGFPVYGDGGIGSWFMETGATLQGSNPFGETNPNSEQDIKSMQRNIKKMDAWDKISGLGDYRGFTKIDDFTQWYDNKKEYEQNRIDLVLSKLSPDVLKHLKSLFPDQNLGDILNTLIRTNGDGWLKTLNSWIKGASYTKSMNNSKTLYKNKEYVDRFNKAIGKIEGNNKIADRLSYNILSNLKDEDGNTYRFNDNFSLDYDKIDSQYKERNIGRGKAYELLHQEILKGNKDIVGKTNGKYSNKYYNDKFGASVIFGKEYLDLLDRLEALESKKEEELTYNELIERGKLRDKNSKFESAAAGYVSRAGSMSESERGVAFGATKDYMKIVDQLHSVTDEETKLKEDYFGEMNVIQRNYKEGSKEFNDAVSKLKNEYAENLKKIGDKRSALTEQLGNYDKYLDDETKKFYDSQCELNIKESAEDIIKRFKELTEGEGALSYLDACNQMSKEFGEGFMNKIISSLDVGEDIKQNIKSKGKDVIAMYLEKDPPVDHIEQMLNDKNINGPEDLEPIFTAIRGAYSTAVAVEKLRYNLTGKNKKVNTTKLNNLFIKASQLWDDYQQFNGAGRPFKTSNAGRKLRVTYYDPASGSSSTVMADLGKYWRGGSGGYFPAGFDGVNMGTYNKNKYNSTDAYLRSTMFSINSKAVTDMNASRYKESHYTKGEDGIRRTQDSAGRGDKKNDYEEGKGPGKAEGGYTNPGAKWDETGILSDGETVHAGEWVAPAWMVKDPAYSPLISLLEKSRVTKKAGMEIASSEKIDNSEVVSKLNHLIQIASQGNEYAALNIKATSEGLSGVSNVIANKPVAIQNTTQRTRSVKSLTK